MVSVPDDYQLLWSVGVTTVAWVGVTLLTRPTDSQKLATFFNSVKPYGIGWNGFKKIAQKEGIHLEEKVGSFSVDLLAMFLGIIIVYSALFGVGMLLYGNIPTATILLSVTLVSVLLLLRTWKKLTF
jgi:hypothetical protein